MAVRKRQQGASGENGRQKQHGQGQTRDTTHRNKYRENGSINQQSSGTGTRVGVGYAVLVAALACAVGILHRNHVAGMFESDRHFSHLSSLERELGFRTEMGLYYSYYKTVVEAPSFRAGVEAVMYDNVTEYPQTINVLKRFNLYPEVILGAMFRAYDGAMSSMGLETKQCWKVNRGEGLSPVLSCEGLGDPAYFYIEGVFLLNGLHLIMLFLFGLFISGSIAGGLVTVVCVFFNHGECTRVQWTPPLRESFAYPFCVLQMFCVCLVLRSSRPTYKHSVLIAAATVCFMLPWQFAQFALLTQTVAVFATYVLLYIGAHKMRVILLGQALGLAVSFVCLFGNEMLLTSFFASCLLTVSIIVLLEPVIELLKLRILIWGAQGVLLAVGTVGVKFVIARVLGVADDAHIGELIKSKFTNFKNFHTMLYTCAVEFDFMERDAMLRLSKTLLAPCAFFVIIVVTYQLLKLEYVRWQKEETSENINNNSPGSQSSQPPVSREHRSKDHAEIVFLLIQWVAFLGMNILIMRLKLFHTPHLCLLSSLIASRKFFRWIGDWWRHHAVIAVLVGLMAIGGISNLTHQRSIMGEFSNIPMEQMIEWINTKSPEGSVFAGPMPTMATVKLCTPRPIVNHPHYEDTGLRERTKKVYTMYSRKPVEEVWQHLRDLQVDYAILEESWCIRRSKPGCGMAEIWDLEDKDNLGAEPACSRLHKNPQPYFTRVFQNNVYDILRVNPEPQSSDSHPQGKRASRDHQNRAGNKRL